MMSKEIAVNTFRPQTRPIAAAMLLALGAVPVYAQQQGSLEPVVVTAPAMTSPLEVVVDPKAPQQPVPANDGASFLKNIPGFSLIRKGGTDGDPVFRGSAASRLNILLDGMEFHGGCGSRMDPPTAYIFPESFDQVTVIKGPQTVRYGNGNSAGVVLFEHDRESVQPGLSGFASVLGGSWGRIDGVGTARVASDKANIGVTLTHAESDDYKDGSGNKVNSAYQRKSATLLGGLNVDANTRIDLDGVISRGEAAYADRTMDGSKFDRESYGVALEKKNISNLVEKINVRIYHSYIDHVMDNYSLRTLSGSASAMNPDRETDGFRLSTNLAMSAVDELTVGFDWREDEHTSRNKAKSMMGADLTPSQADQYVNLPRLTDYQSRFLGVFGEWTHRVDLSRKLVSGIRLDQWSADRWYVDMSNNQTYQGDASETLRSGFLRFEQDLASYGTVYVGYGISQRPMDYWEANRYEGIKSGVGDLKPETTHQIDAGLLWKQNQFKGSLSAFYAKVRDYILVYSNSTAMNCNGTTFANARSSMGCVASGNIDATRYGFELEGSYQLSSAVRAFASFAYVYANNDTMNVPLAQTPPLEIKLGLDQIINKWTWGAVVRGVAKQDRIHADYGSVVGVDRSMATPGFITLGINGSFRPNPAALISFGVDNLFDRNYYEHISRTDGSVPGFTTQTGTAVNEPGRTFWLKGQITF